MLQVLCQNQTTDGAGSPAVLSPGALGDQLAPMQERTVSIPAGSVFNGATLSLEKLGYGLDGSDDDNWAPLDDYSWTEPGVKNLRIRAYAIRSVISSAGGSTDITCHME